MPNRRFNTQVTNPMKMGGRVKKRGGGLSTARKDMRSGYYHDDMGMKGGPMMKKGGDVKKIEKTFGSKKKKKNLKKVDSKKNPGLAKLPTQVRNKMGFMKKGGAVK